MWSVQRAVYLLLLLSTGASAHEFWIDPQRFRVPAGEAIRADLRVGEHFKGDALVYRPSRFVRFTVIGPDRRRPVEGTIGDLPAASVLPRQPGLHVLAYQSRPSQVTYKDFQEFRAFLGNHGLDWVAEAHRQRGLGESRIEEAFSRYAKALVTVGDGTGGDRPLGLPLELVAEANPYNGPPGASIPVRLLWQGEPLAGAQVDVFRRRPGCPATRTALVTDGHGRALVPAAGGRILVNAVHMKAASRQRRLATGAVWHSLWASLTFALPEPGGAGPASGDCRG